MLKGIDVWSKSGVIDWGKVKQAGHSFAYIRAAYGDVADQAAGPNLQGARAAGLARGVYHFIRTTRSYQAQLDLMLHLIDTLHIGKGDLPPVVDVEDNPEFDGAWNTANNRSYLAAIEQWIAAVHKMTGAWPVIYTRSGFWERLGNPAGFAHCPLWIASYRAAPPALPATWNNFTFWQHDPAGTVDGVQAEVDLNYFVGADHKALERLLLK
jgi:lysozyme